MTAGTIQAIPTQYAGCLFRSRLEARWAVFFDALGEPWEYEPQGYALPSGWYLPDFWLPKTESWVEVKGARPTEQELRKFSELMKSVCANGHRCRMLVGEIPRASTAHPALSFRPALPALVPSTEYIMVTHADGSSAIAATGYDGLFSFDWRECADIPIEYWVTKPTWWFPSYSRENIDAALTAARSARFEHGQSGRTL